MIVRKLPRLYRTMATSGPEMQLPPAGSKVQKTSPKRRVRSSSADATAPPVSSPSSPAGTSNSRSLSLSLSSSSSSATSQGAASSSDGHSHPPAPQTTNSAPVHPYISSNPPFHTHAFFLVLERTFPTPVARALMRATRGLLVDRIGRVRREGLGLKDLDNVGTPSWLLLLLIMSHFSKPTFSARHCQNSVRKALCVHGMRLQNYKPPWLL
jgi:hypothetical protein